MSTSRITVGAASAGPLSVTVSTADQSYLLDENTAVGGGDLAVTPVEAALGAPAGCSAITMKPVAAHARGIAGDGVRQ